MDAIASVLLLVGSLLTLLAAIGLLRFPDVLTRMHAATKPATAGLLLILIGTALLMPDASQVAKLMLVALLQFVTAPVGAHLIGRAVFRSRQPLAPSTHLDDESRRRSGRSDGSGTVG
jgi:multicomponent Na+:H+ antiporter subunit G